MGVSDGGITEVPDDPNDPTLNGSFTEIEMVEGHNEQTMSKVFSALRNTGATERQALDAIHQMQAAGILFLEMVEKAV